MLLFLLWEQVGQERVEGTIVDWTGLWTACFVVGLAKNSNFLIDFCCLRPLHYVPHCTNKQSTRQQKNSQTIRIGTNGGGEGWVGATQA